MVPAHEVQHFRVVKTKALQDFDAFARVLLNQLALPVGGCRVLARQTILITRHANIHEQGCIDQSLPVGLRHDQLARRQLTHYHA